ncbi:2-dehydro-3-deoxyphosphogluconate aldolase/(4S)-4-hydroxy-2-oxoglutarate aldolase [Streptacidiphilus sp. MAP12-33]|uniref:bifunctional 4-hydroxy-2-oxoglutarate aldolase/2-dehydro-3-deoxy-phosphogluconate aldolase n=1 Tax=Streptacidiphilus sp. MAP12-33 TaxID=3156266 RepID=UPI0035115B85
MSSLLAQLAHSPVIAVVRAPAIADAALLCAALAAGGVTCTELTFTTPGMTTHLRRAAEAGHHVGAGTVLTADQARAAIDAGASFLVTPGLRAEVAAVATRHSVPLVLGALTPTEVARALDLGAEAVKIFPARAFGPTYLRDLHGPFPGTPLIASGGVNATNASDFLTHGAAAVCAGTDVVPAGAVASGEYRTVTTRALDFATTVLRGREELRDKPPT